ncbi:amidohydrolase family protein, partial [Burkholderiales bacterium]|nr:amidohydrolase family protein [Burkholderiales bacterium]
MLDIRFDNVTIINGSGEPGFLGSLGVLDGRIAEVGTFEASAKETIDCSGLSIMPGIVDNHTHYDAQVTWDPYCNPSPALGVTTLVMGNCGFTIAPCRPNDRDITMKNLTQVEGMSIDALQTGIDWSFETFPQYLDMLEKRGVAPNVSCFVGHSSVRTYVLQGDASKRAATPKEVERMRAIVVEAMEAGACGFATTRYPGHNGENGIPMPSRLADEVEMLSLSSALKDIG